MQAKSSERQIFESGASSHIAYTFKKLGPYRGLGTIKLNCKLLYVKINSFEPRDILFKSEFPVNLLSGKALKAKGYVRNDKMYRANETKSGKFLLILHSWVNCYSCYIYIVTSAEAHT